MTKMGSVAIFSLALAALGTVGCGAAVDAPTESSDNGIPASASTSDALAPPVGAEGQGRDVSGLTLGSALSEQPLVAHGGGGGGFTGHVTPSAVIWAVQVNSGSYVDRITIFWYQPSQPDNLFRTGDRFGQVSFGGGGGGANPMFACDTVHGQGVIGIRGASGNLLDRIGVICGSVTNPDPFNPNNQFSPLFGGGGGGFFDDRCSPGRLVDSFNVRSGSLIDNLQAICINAH
jgi:hypothetical protein